MPQFCSACLPGTRSRFGGAKSGHVPVLNQAEKVLKQIFEIRVVGYHNFMGFVLWVVVGSDLVKCLLLRDNYLIAGYSGI